jgi:hypothetical protein
MTHRVKTGHLHRVHRGVYAVGRPATTPLERASAAVLACGRGAALSHRSAITLWGLWKRWTFPLDVTAPADRRPPGIVVHRSRSFGRSEVRTQLGIRVTSPGRTLLDTAADLTAEVRSRTVNDALHSGLVTRSQLQDVLDRHPNHPGTRLLAPFTDTTDGPSRSGWEDAFPAFCARHGLPRPAMNVRVLGYVVDALFADERVIVELDGWRFHSGRDAFETDRERDASTLSAGFATVRITWKRMMRTPHREADRLHAILRARREQAA